MPHRIIPATLSLREDGTLVAPDYGDIYHSAAGALAQADYVFLQGNDLPARWQRRRSFTIVETGFGAGCNFLVTWAAWRNDPARCERLHFVSVEKHPFQRDDLRTAALHVTRSAGGSLDALAHELADAWPVLMPGLHRLEFEGGRVTLTLCLGDALELLPDLVARADAFYLDGFAPSKNPDIWSAHVFRALAKLADEQATFSTYSSSGHVKRALEEAGFAYTKVEGFSGKRAMLIGKFAPRWRVRRYEPPRAIETASRDAIIIGAGLAGGALAERLSARGWQLNLIDRQAHPASEASGNPAGVFHPLVTSDDNPASRLSRAGFFYALRRWQALEANGYAFSRTREGLIQLEDNAETFDRMRKQIDTLRIPEQYVRAISRSDAQELLGTRVAHDGWFYPQGGSIDPRALVAAQCAQAGNYLTRTLNAFVARLLYRSGKWCALDRDGRTLAEASVAIVANANDAARLAGLHHAPTQPVRGQLSLLPAGWGLGLHLPVIGDGYAARLADGSLLTGATFELDDLEAEPRRSGHEENLHRLAALLPDSAASELDPAGLPGRVAFRCVTSDRLPLAGALADEDQAIARKHTLRGAHCRDLPRRHGLYGAFAYGSRGLVWAAIMAELVASQLNGEPWPIERDLAEAVDPSRYLMRALRQNTPG